MKRIRQMTKFQGFLLDLFPIHPRDRTLVSFDFSQDLVLFASRNRDHSHARHPLELEPQDHVAEHAPLS